MIPQAFIDDLLQRIDVVEIVGRHVKLRKGGANYSGLCPFHNEKSPSFTVSPTKQFYHCFGCGAHGTALGFLIEYSGLTFPEAVRDLAQSVGMAVPDDRATPRGERSASHDPADGGGERHDGDPGAGADREAFDPSRSRAAHIIAALETARSYYRNQLRGSPRAIDYLKRRGLTGEVAGRFGLGYAPDGWNGLETAFDDYRAPLLVDAGLVISKVSEASDGASDGASAGAAAGKSGGATPGATRSARVYDRFRDRVMFPIRNTRGRVIGFGGRIIDEGEPKYLNSPETTVFQKGQELYGLFEARQAIRETGFALVVEGYMDVVALAQHGVANAVATLGTACTANHVQKLLRQVDRVTFSFDGDAAGRKAAWRALESSLPFATDDKALSFLFLPAEHDPDSYIRATGRDAFLAAVGAALPLSEYLLREIARDNDLRTAEGRAKALFDARPLVAALPAGALRLQIVRALAAATATQEAEVLALFQIKAAAAPRRAPRRIDREPPQGLAERALVALIKYPVHARSLSASDLATLDEGAGEARDLIVEVVEAAKAQGRDVDFLVMSNALRDSPNAAVHEAMMQRILADDETRRDLLHLDGGDDGGDSDDAGRDGGAALERRAARRQEQFDAAAQELVDVVHRLRLQIVEARLRQRTGEVGSGGMHDPAAREELARLVAERDRLRRG